MCLDRLTELRHVSRGWKIFEYDGTHYRPYLQPHQRMQAGIWYDDEKTEPIATGWIKYPTGYHFYEDKEEAIKKFKSVFHNPIRFVLKEVEVQSIVASGIQSLYKVSVARRIKICA